MISNVKEEIKKIYARVLPSKDINQVFEQFKGREVDLYKALCRKYHLEEQYTKILSKSKKDMHEKEKEREKEDRMHEIQQAEAGKAAPSRPGETAAVPAAEVAAADDAEVAAADDAPADAAADDAPADATSDATAADRATADATATPAAVVRPKSPEMPPKAKVIRAWNPQRGTYGVPKFMRPSAKMSRPTPPPPPAKAGSSQTVVAAGSTCTSPASSIQTCWSHPSKAKADPCSKGTCTKGQTQNTHA